MNRHTAFTLGVAIVVALSAVSAVRGATAESRPAVTTKVMIAGLKAIQYPVAHPKKLSCRGLSVPVKGGHSSFRCIATLMTHKQRRFYTRTITGGWLCAGMKRSHCVMLSRGFFPASAADNQGWQTTAVVGWLRAHRIDVNGAASIECAGLRSPMTCTLAKKPTVRVVLTYQKAGGGYVETASRHAG